jgi:hypothetical protein
VPCTYCIKIEEELVQSITTAIHEAHDRLMTLTKHLKIHYDLMEDNTPDAKAMETTKRMRYPMTTVDASKLISLRISNEAMKITTTMTSQRIRHQKVSTLPALAGAGQSFHLV